MNHNSNLDILRGLASSVVVWRHITGYSNDFDSHSRFPSFISSYNPPAHLCVLIFFILSGYVIQANTAKLANKNLIYQYVGKRLVRILPIYFLAITFTFLLTPDRYSLLEFLSNLFCFSVPMDNVMVVNSPVWSLQYELLYYFVFILFSYFNLNLRISLVLLMLTSGLLFLVYRVTFIHPLIISLLVGFVFWLFGASLAKIGSV